MAGPVPSDYFPASEPGAKSSSFTMRMPRDLRVQVGEYAKARGVSSNKAAIHLIRRGLANDALQADFSEMLDARFAAMLVAVEDHLSQVVSGSLSAGLGALDEKAQVSCARAGRAAQASLGTLAILSWLLPYLTTNINNAALMIRYTMAEEFGRPEEADAVTLFPDTSAVSEMRDYGSIFDFAYSGVGGNLSRQGGRGLAQSVARALQQSGLGDSGLFGLTPEQVDALAKGPEARTYSSIASKAGL